MKRRILLVDDEVAVLLTLKAVLEISGFEVETAASAGKGKVAIKKGVYDMVITDMKMESDESGREVIVAARTASYHPAVALLTAFPVADEDWQGMGADKMLVKPMQTRLLIQQVEKLLDSHQAKLKKMAAAGAAAGLAAGFAAGLAAAAVGTLTPAKEPKKAGAPVKATGAKRASVVKKAATTKAVAKKSSPKKAAK